MYILGGIFVMHDAFRPGATIVSGYGPCNVREHWGLGYKQDPFL